MTGYADVPLRLDDEPVEPLLDWARAELTAAGRRGAGEPDLVRRRSWSTVLRVPTDGGPVWVKANAREFAYEAALLQLLSAYAGAHVLHPLAARPDVGWFVTADGGPVLDDHEGPVGQSRWVELLTGYADLQRRMGAHQTELRGIGVLDCSPPTLGGWYRRVLARAEQEPHSRPLLDGAWDRLRDLIPATDGWAAELARSQVPISVEHNDLHADNVFVGQAHAPGLRIFDWADTTLTHPFVGLRRALLTASGADDDAAVRTDVDVEVVRDSYLRCWIGDGTDAAASIPAALRRDVRLAGQLSWVVVGASWLRLPAPLDEAFGGYFASFLTGYLDGAEQLDT